MIIEFIQNGRQPNPTFVGCCNDLQIAFGSGMTHRKDAFLSYENNTISIDSSIHKEKIDGHIATQVSDLICNGKRIGYIFPDLVAKKKYCFYLLDMIFLTVQSMEIITNFTKSVWALKSIMFVFIILQIN